jgi:hypothetical protein
VARDAAAHLDLGEHSSLTRRAVGRTTDDNAPAQSHSLAYGDSHGNKLTSGNISHAMVYAHADCNTSPYSTRARHGIQPIAKPVV